jgi:hypothetical protein
MEKVDPRYSASPSARVELEPPAAAGGGVDGDGDFDEDDEDAMLERALLLSQQVEIDFKFPTELFFITLRVRCAFLGRNLHSRMSTVPTPARLKLLHASDQWHSSRVFTLLTGRHCNFRPNTKGIAHRVDGTVRVFRHCFALEDAIGSHAYSLQANLRATNNIPLGNCLSPFPR